MSENKHDGVNIPYFIHEGEMHRLETIIRKLWILVLVIFLTLIATNAVWIVYENQFEDVYIEQEGTTDGGGANYFNGTGELNIYGESKTDH